MSDDTYKQNTIQFLLNGQKISITDPEPTKSILYYLREDKKLTGTKEGCAEGDCGACTVVIGELENETKSKAELKTVNACIQFLPTLDGKALFTVEYLRQQITNTENTATSLHPVQQSMVDHNGSQCGFCTPGFIMSLWNVYNKHQSTNTKPDQTEVRRALTGNLCRCTGYRPILDAAQKMFDFPEVEFNSKKLLEELASIQRGDSLAYKVEDNQFFSPKNIAQLANLKSQFPDAIILAGGTDVGLWVNKQFSPLQTIIYLGEVAELKQVTTTDDHLMIGAGVTLTKAYQAISKHYPEMDEMWERFASMPIRNAGTLGGNVANGSPIGDSMPTLIALEAEVVLRNKKGSRTLLLESLYLDYMKKDMQTDEFVEAIKLPLPYKKTNKQPNNISQESGEVSEQYFRCYKLSKRYDSDISAVFSAFTFTLKHNELSNKTIVEKCIIAYGGMAAIPKRATLCEQSLVNQEWNEENIQNAMEALKSDYSPMSDGRASDSNRMQSAANLLYRFYLETRTKNPILPKSLNVFADRSLHIPIKNNTATTANPKGFTK